MHAWNPRTLSIILLPSIRRREQTRANPAKNRKIFVSLFSIYIVVRNWYIYLGEKGAMDLFCVFILLAIVCRLIIVLQMFIDMHRNLSEFIMGIAVN